MFAINWLKQLGIPVLGRSRLAQRSRNGWHPRRRPPTRPFHPHLEHLETRITPADVLSTANNILDYLNIGASAAQSAFAAMANQASSQLAKLATSGIFVTPNQALTALNLEVSSQAGAGQALSVLENVAPNVLNTLQNSLQNAAYFSNVSTYLISGGQTLMSAAQKDLGGTVQNGIGTAISAGAPAYFGLGVGGLLSLEYSLLSKYVATLPSVQAFNNNLADQALALIPGLETGIYNFNKGFESLVTGAESAFQNFFNPPPPATTTTTQQPTDTTPPPTQQQPPTFDPDTDGDDDTGVAGY